MTVPRRFGTAVVLSLAVVTFAALAVTSHGFPVQHVSLNDGGIWVTNNQDGAFGRFTKPIAQLDGEVTSPSANPVLEVWQNGPAVAAYDASAGRVYAINDYETMFSDAGAPVSPAPGGIALGDTTLAVLGTDHALRTATLEAGGTSLAALTATAKPLAAHLAANAAVAVGSDDTVWVAGGGQLRGYPEGARPVVSALPLPASDPMQVTTVGSIPVVADVTTRTLYLPDSGHTVSLPAAGTSPGFELQQPSGPSGVVVVATGQGLYSADLGNGQLTTLSSGRSGDVAAPVQVAGCVHAAWNNGDSGTYVRSCGAPPPATRATQSFTLDSPNPSLAFRVNNDEVVLNDTTDGGVFLVDTTITSVRPKWSQKNTAGKSNVSAPAYDQQQNKLQAKPVTQGVRPGRTTVVHVLDNDKGPAGVTYAVTAVGKPDQPGVSVAIAPDAQTVLATVGPGLTADAHFQYTIDDGRGHIASAEVTLVPRARDQNAAPNLQPNYQPPSLTVASGGTLVVPVIGYWRDFDGDPLYVDGNSVRYTAGSASVTTGGAISFTAPQTATRQTVTIKYGVSDGIVAKPAQASLSVTVLSSSSTTFVRPVAEPDAAQAVAGAPVTIQPLANDLPGVDPTNPAARLTLAAPVTAPRGATVSTDLNAGTVTFTAQRPGDYFLTYADAFGAAPTASGTIRVHVIPATGTPLPPVTMPDVAVLHGQQPALTDVLADDYDPQGWILGVTGATADTPGIHVAVVDQRWLRITADNPTPGTTATVTYTVSDGRTSASGTVAVTAVPADLNADQITTQDASIVVRAGDSAAVPVLAGDSSTIGLPLSLEGTPPTATPPIDGLLATVQGADVRITAPASVTTEEETTVSYVATDASGAAATGRLDVTIEPAPSKARPDQPPAPEEVDTRETAGDIAVIKIPVYGIDPDGDSATVTAVTVPPALGRIVAVGPDTISYQSYPDSAGTDTFSYEVTDRYGLTGTGQVRIGVLPPGPPQPPVAVDDVISAPPGVALHWNVLANDYVAAGDTATVLPLAKTNKSVPAGVRLAGSYVYLQVPASPSDPPVELTYGITDGSTPSLAQVIVHPVAGAKLPPIANDDIAPPPPAGAASVTVNVLRNDDDPVGSPGDLRINRVPAGVTVHGQSLTIPLTAQPREVPYEVIAPDGLTATAVVDVPGTASSAIRLKPGARITLKRDGSITVPLASVLTDTAGRQLRITTLNQLVASPAGQVTVDANQATAFGVRALGGYTGPGAVSVQVYDGATLQDPRGHTATVTIPVQVGPDVPVLRCPQAALPVVEGGAPQAYDIGQLCNVWVDTTIAAPAPSYTAGWAKAAGGVGASVPGGTSLQLAAASGAQPGAAGTLRITAAGTTASGLLNVTVIKAPPPAGRAVSVTVFAGHSVTVDLSQYVTSPLAQPDIHVVNVTQRAGATVTSGGSTVTITPGLDTKGTIPLVATVTDVPGRADREITVAITVTVIGRPGKPGQPSATASNGAIVVSFTPASPNGAPVEFYTVYTNGQPHNCPAAPCTITGLTNGVSYTVYVTATNSVDNSYPSARTTAEPNAVPDQVTGLAPNPGNRTITLSWQPAHYSGTPPTGYQVEISPAPTGQSPLLTLGVVTSNPFTGLTNGVKYTFRVKAFNVLRTGIRGNGPWSAPVTAVPFGKPLWSSAPSAAGASVPNANDERAITVSWGAAAGNGRSITDYSVQVWTSSSAAGPWSEDTADEIPAQPPTAFGSSGTYTQSFNPKDTSTWYEYAVTATNNPGSLAQSSRTGPIQAALAPGQPGTPSVSVAPASTGPSYGDGTVHVQFTVPQPHSARLSYVQYALNAASFATTDTAQQWTGLTPGQPVTESITGLTNGSAYEVYLEACNDAGLCSSPVDAGSAVPYGPPPAPSVTATVNGTSIVYSWSGVGNGRSATLRVCIDSGCTDYPNVPAVPPAYSGGTTVPYGYNQTHTITAYITDAAGQQSPTVSASATIPPPPPPPPSVSVSEGGAQTGSGCTVNCHWVDITVSNFPAGATLTYSCWDNGAQYWPRTAGATVTAPVHADGSGNASFQSVCLWGYWGNSSQHLQANVNGTFSP